MVRLALGLLKGPVSRALPFLAAAAVFLGAVFWVMQLIDDRVSLQRDLQGARSELAAAQADLERAAEVARVHRAHLARAAERARQWDALSRELQAMEGRNAPLSPLLRAAAERLYLARP